MTSYNSETLDDVIRMAERLMDQVVKHGAVQRGNYFDNKRKWDDHKRNNNYNNFHNRNNNNLHYRNNNNNNQYRNNNHHHQQNRRQKTVKAFVAAPAQAWGYALQHPLCEKCHQHHVGPCVV